MEGGFKIIQKHSFNEKLRKEIVGQMERKGMSILEVSREYEVS
jgi:transposase